MDFEIFFTATLSEKFAVIVIICIMHIPPHPKNVTLAK